ncbi:MAG TPA: lysylphosphatidylglycerol synthase transmembrane domain-containing protein [bacterium]
MKRRVAVGLALSLLFIYLSFWKLDLAGLFSGEAGILAAFFGQPRIKLHQLGEVLTQVRFFYIILSVLLLIFSLFFRAQRWRIILQPVSPQIRYWPVYAAMNAGYMINNVLPLRLGEILRAYILGKAENVSKSSVLATIIVERVIDSLAALILLGITLFFFPFPDWIRNGLFYLGGAIILLVIFLFALLIKTAWTLELLRRMLKPFPQKWTEPVLKAINSFSGGLEILRSSHHYIAVLIHTVILQICYIVSVFVILLAFNLMAPEYPKIIDNPLLASVVLLVIITIGISIPSAPGAVGTFHGIVAFGVSLFGVSAEISLGFAIILHLVNYIPLTALGLACFWSQHFKFSEVRKQLPGES